MSNSKKIVIGFVKNGGKFLKDEVLDINENYVITKNNGNIKTNKIVICTGVWSGQFLKKTRKNT